MFSSAYNMKLIEFTSLFRDTIEKEILDSLFVYKLIENDSINLRNPHVKKIINYFIIFYVCKHINSKSLEKVVVVVQPELISDEALIGRYCSLDAFRNMIRKTMNLLKKTHQKNMTILKIPMDISCIDTVKYVFNKSNS